ncbi:MAG: tRNA pseudouridine(38-40) synthase TruA [Saprospiraceae bacterium]|nr:tRNA pseudouridine(38-40) synthase TruA [Saprospiraceae bacterium]
MKFFLHLSYKGTHYHGWQWQPKHTSVQETLQGALEEMLGHKVNCVGCGRTDAGVHASQYFCHIIVEDDFDYDPVFRLNKILPNDITIHHFIKVGWDAHAQKDAISRTYTYRIHTTKDAFLSELSTYYPKENMDVGLMQKAVEILPRYRDFRAMCRQPDRYRTTHCELTAAQLLVENDGERLSFVFTASRFLRGMVRILVGQILEVGYGRESLEAFENNLKTGQAPAFTKGAYPQGLYLSGVKYGFLDIG